jgi:hypothetical protein
MNASTPPFRNILTGEKKPHKKPIIKTIIKFLNFNPDFPEPEVPLPPIIEFGINW